jgi:wyosine [tRNA(Phe)-imidazoG37] synthetase (radical SAM superfamily)
MNRLHKGLRLNTVLKGIQDFAEAFKGTFVSETMLIDGIRYYMRKLLSRRRQ